MRNQQDLIALAGVFILIVIFNYSPKIGGTLIAITVLGMLLNLDKVDMKV